MLEYAAGTGCLSILQNIFWTFQPFRPILLRRARLASLQAGASRDDAPVGDDPTLALQAMKSSRGKEITG
jgi:hypothetical protein